jgi:hypothetical protein
VPITTIRHHANPAEAWPLAMRAIGEATGCTDEAVRDFLDSRQLEAAIDAAVERWMGWTIDGYIEAELGIPRGLPYLTGFVTHFEILAEIEGTV